MTLFRRRAVLVIDDLRIENLDVKFKVSSSDDGSLGKAEVSVFNLNRPHRKELEGKKNVPVSLLAGYEDQELAQIFKGTMRQVFSERDPPDWITTLRSGDGDGSAQTRVNKSYGPGSTFETMWRDAAKALEADGLGLGNSLDFFKKGKFKEGITELFKGGNLQGSAMKELRRLAKGAKLEIAIQDNELVVTETGKPLGATAVLLSPSTGLVGSPTRGAKGELKARSLIIPGLKPKRKVQIESALVSGLYVIQKTSYKGDTSANDWYAEIECREAP